MKFSFKFQLTFLGSCNHNFYIDTYYIKYDIGISVSVSRESDI